METVDEVVATWLTVFNMYSICQGLTYPEAWNSFALMVNAYTIETIHSHGQYFSLLWKMSEHAAIVMRWADERMQSCVKKHQVRHLSKDGFYQVRFSPIVARRFYSLPPFKWSVWRGMVQSQPGRKSKMCLFPPDPSLAIWQIKEKQVTGLHYSWKRQTRGGICFIDGEQRTMESGIFFVTFRPFEGKGEKESNLRPRVDAGKYKRPSRVIFSLRCGG